VDRHPDPQKLVNQSMKILDGNSYIKRYKAVIQGDIVVLRNWKGKKINEVDTKLLKEVDNDNAKTFGLSRPRQAPLYYMANGRGAGSFVPNPLS
jgi:hypothetical protein